MATIAQEQEKIDIGRVIQRGFATLGAYFGPFLGLAFLMVGLPTLIMQYFLLKDTNTVESVLATYTSPLFLLSILVSLFSGALLQAAVVRSSLLYLGGRTPDISQSVANCFRLILPLLGLTILTTVLTYVGMIFLVVPGIIIYLMLSVSVPALVEERGGIIQSMKRSRELTKGSRARIFLLLILFSIAYVIALAVLGYVVGYAFGSLGLSGIWLQVAITALTGVVTGLIAATMLASLYFELRTVKEGASIDGLADIFA